MNRTLNLYSFTNFISKHSLIQIPNKKNGSTSFMVKGGEWTVGGDSTWLSHSLSPISQLTVH
uniref:Uncharacterized protein n=1 Tax=Nelumbo nucifera TaxID=4432 RepID=A0A822Y1V9_NELNU|nr:TPA_asm: hypothetical protein HUJ06_027700 [Nelumbo nucifera]